MNDYSRKGSLIALLAGVFIIGVVLGVNWCKVEYKNLWNEDTTMLEDLNDALKQDQSKRLFLVVITENGQNFISSIGEEFKIKSVIYKKGEK